MPTGKQIAAACAERVARVNLEMGGKDPFIVCADVADELEVAARGGAWAAFLNAGQVCTSAERFYVVDEVYDDYVERFVEHTRSARRRRPVRPEHRHRADGLGQPARQGRRRRSRRRSPRAPRWSPAATRRSATAATSSTPAVVTGAPAETDLLREETFGPVAPLVSVGSLDEAIELANSTRFGLGANVYTRDLRTMLRCLREIKAGTVWFNDPLTDNDAGPFGGFKQSGLGRELGREGLEAFQETKHVHIETEIERKEWWYPYSEYSATTRPHDGAGADVEMATITEARTLRNYVGGGWVEAEASTGTLEDRDPATGELAAMVPLSGAADVDAAVRAARAAQPGVARASPRSGAPAR